MAKTLPCCSSAVVSELVVVVNKLLEALYMFGVEYETNAPVNAPTMNRAKISSQ